MSSNFPPNSNAPRSIRNLFFKKLYLLPVAALITLIAVALTLLPTSAAPFTGQTGTPWVGERGITETTAQIMERQRKTATTTQTPRESRPPLRANHVKAQNPNAPDVAQYPAPAQHAPNASDSPHTPQTQGISFTGSTFSDKGLAPPDTMGAAGPTQFGVFVNNRFRTFNKTSGTADGALDVDPDVFFASVLTPAANNGTSDPKVRYDRLSGRWIVVMIDVVNNSNRILLATSNTSTITSATAWTFYFMQNDIVAPAGDTGDFADYPTLGIDNNALYIGVNVFSSGTGSFVGTTGFVVRKSSILSGGPIVATAFRGLALGTGEGPYTPQGVDNFDTTATEGYFIGVSNVSFSRLVIRRVSDPGGTPTISGNLLLTVPTTRYPVNVPNLGGSAALDALDDRLFAAMIQNGRLWTAHNIEVNSSGVGTTGGGRDGSRWYEIQNLTTTPSLVQAGTVFDSAASNPRFYWIPSVAVSGQGHAALGFSTSGAAEHVNAATVGRLSSDTLGTTQTPLLYTNSTFNYNNFVNRWGDYSYTSIDPDDNMTMWTIQEFVDATNSYAERVVKLIAPPPATPASTSPASVVNGQASVNVTVTGTQVSGSGFYDPGTGFPNRIGAAVSGGVTVNSVTYVSPTSLTLNISTVGTTAGVKDVTITNPDGQSTTGVGVLTVTSAAGPPATITATAGTPQSAVVNTAFTTQLQATVLDASNVPVSGVLVTFTAPAASPSGIFPSGNTATTNASGQASVPFTADDVAGGPYNVTANITPALPTPATFVLTNVAGPPATIGASAGTPQSTEVTTPFPVSLQAFVQDSFGNPVSGVVVTFTVPITGPSATFPSGNTATTNATGEVTVPITANAIAGGPYNVTANVNPALATPATFILTNLPGPAATITATAGTPQTTVINTPFPIQLQATVRDASSNPISGTLVTFTAPASGPSGTFPSGNTATTNANGQASVPFTADGTAGGPYNVTANITPDLPQDAVFVLTNTNCDPLVVTVSSDTGSCGSLRAAITQANTLISSQNVSITFTTSSVVITSALPVINNSGTFTLTITGGCTTETVGGVTRGIAGVTLTKSGVFNSVGLSFNNHVVVNGLAITGFTDYALDITGSNNVVTCNRIGTADGTTALANGGGVRIAGSNNQLGLTGQSASGNLISGNTGSGIRVLSGTNNQGYYNWIGLQKNGTSLLGNGAPGAISVASGAHFKSGRGNRAHN